MLQFTKMHGLGNDFALFDLVSQKGRISPALVRRLADRRLGIGFDQLLAVSPPGRPDADFKYAIYNADGSEAEQCGNGARCLLRFVRDRGLTGKRQLAFEAPKGLVEAWLEEDGQVTLDLGPPRLAPAEVPFLADAAAPCYQVPVPAAEGGALRLAAVNVGNPHAVVQVEDAQATDVQSLGAALERHERFPERANVGFMQLVARDAIRLRVFERGLGETPACGSGACAALVAGRLWGLLDEAVTVELPGGALRVSWAGEGAGVRMTGPACHVYDGTVQA